MGSSSLPESHHAASSHCFLFSLASGGVYPAARVTPHAGELLPHRFTLTTRLKKPVRRFTFCCTCPDLTIGRRYRPPRSAKPGLSSREKFSASDRPINSCFCFIGCGSVSTGNLNVKQQCHFKILNTLPPVPTSLQDDLCAQAQSFLKLTNASEFVSGKAFSHCGTA